MWRIAENIAKKENAQYLITGENLAQVASQTLSNMQTTQSAVQISILRPLLCNDKVETIAMAREIDTYEISKGPEVCCLLGPKNPATSSSKEIIEKEEENTDEIMEELRGSIDSKMLITTTPTIEGKQIKETLGLVRGNTVRSRWFGRDILAGFKNLIGGEIKSYTEMLTAAREEAVQRMIAEAQKMNADAIVNVRLTIAEMMNGSATEILAYGTAIKLK